MSSSLGESLSWSTSVAFIGACVLCWGSVVNCSLVLILVSMRLAVCLSRMMRFSYYVSNLVMGGGCSLVWVSVVEGGANGHIFLLGDGSHRWHGPPVLLLCQFGR